LDGSEMVKFSPNVVLIASSHGALSQMLAEAATIVKNAAAIIIVVLRMENSYISLYLNLEKMKSWGFKPSARRHSTGISHSVPFLREPDIISMCGLRSPPAPA
jgi:hypothetical protein